MNINLYYQNKIYNFLLPKVIEGSYSFDVDKNETTKLINVEARDGKWVIFSVEGVNLVENNQAVSYMLLKDNTFYVINRNNQNYLIYVEDVSLNKFQAYSYSNFKMIIGNTVNSNIKYNCPFLAQNEVTIYTNENQIILEQTQLVAYKNDRIISESRAYLKIGDVISIYGLKIIILNGLVFFNNPGSMIAISNFNFGLSPYEFQKDELPKNFPVIDKELYEKEDYFSKSPRIRRVIETKDINLSPPPQNQSEPETPLLLLIGPMLTMGIMSMTTIIQLVAKLSSGETKIQNSWPQLLTASAMLLSMLVWPLVTNVYNKKRRVKQRENMVAKYDQYLIKKEKEIEEEVHLQKEILNENLITVNDCLDIIQKRNVGFWDKRLDQSDFMNVRIGMGRQPLDANINYKEEDFSIDEDELRQKADVLKERYKYITNVPASYSFYENKITAIMGMSKDKSFAFVNNILLQLLTFYSYEDLKIVIFTNEKNKENWEYVKYLNHNFDNPRRFRFFASDQESAKAVMEYLSQVFYYRTSEKQENPEKPYYLIIIDDYDQVKRFDFIKELTELDDENNKVFSTIIIEEKLNKLPSKCNSFISLSQSNSAILKNSYEKQEQIPFKDEINYNIDMIGISKIMSNIPIEFEEGIGRLPDAISFLEMHKVGKVEQLNILNRWNTNDSTISLRAEIGVDDQEDIMYLDLHEKHHGPHGLIAGTTGSGKSEFIITYILSMCINYSPDDISFILIDYKGGGLALAFENRTTGVVLPHLAGTITNLDKAEMDRTLVSIESETKRRQRLFNEARDLTGESTMDIYKYQRLYKEGKLTEPISHLFIICDEFAELKAQQPDFMDNLISVARIGRSLGVHLILATQKPSGVVNDQIWSNTRFRVCLKVQDEADSKEMLKKPDAAHIKQAGRYYLQVGYDEIYSLGQSGYTGANYYPSDKIVKQVDKSVNFIDDCGQFIKSIQASGGPRIQAQGEQLQAVMKLIIDTASKVNKSSKRLWLSNIPDTILIDALEKKYSFTPENYKFEAIVGEYDAPELQTQGIVKYDLLEDGNTIIYGNDSIEREMLLNSVIYSLSKYHSPEEINFYMLDLGSESLRIYEKLPHFGGYVTINEDNRINNLFNIINGEISKRKKLFSNYGGEYEKYIKSGGEKLPLLVVILNNFDSIKDNFDDLVYNVIPDVTRDSDRYGIVFILTGAGTTSIRMNISQNFKNFFAFKLKDKYEYQNIFSKRKDIMPRDILGRGILNNGDLHEFQTASIDVPENGDDVVMNFIDEINKKYENYKSYLPLPILPDRVRIKDVSNYVTSLKKLPVGISKSTVEIQYMDFISNLGTVISSNHFDMTIPFTKSLITLAKQIKGINLIIFDPKSTLGLSKEEYPNYFTDNFDNVVVKIKDYVDNLIKNDSAQEGLLIINGVDDLLKKIANQDDLEQLTQALKNYEKIGTIFVETNGRFKNHTLSRWFKNLYNNSNGVWIGDGVSLQTIVSCTINRAMQAKVKDNSFGYVISDNSAEQCKLLDFFTDDD